jgi:hypothetical protein
MQFDNHGTILYTSSEVFPRIVNLFNTILSQNKFVSYNFMALHHFVIFDLQTVCHT